MYVSNVEMVRANGADALLGATIVSERNGSVFHADINGSFSTGNYYIYCNETDTCKIECIEQGCEALCLYCYGTCLVYCDPDMGIDCPDPRCSNSTEYTISNNMTTMSTTNGFDDTVAVSNITSTLVTTDGSDDGDQSDDLPTSAYCLYSLSFAVFAAVYISF